MSEIFSKDELKQISTSKKPKHIALIMDGNRRWAEEQKVSALEGHYRGAENLVTIINAALECEIEVVSAFAFSTENWQREKKEIDDLMILFETYLINQRELLEKNGISLKLIGNLSFLPERVRKAYCDTQAVTKKGKKMTLMVGMNYGAKDEILRAFNRILKEKKVDQIEESFFSSYLDTFPFPDPDLVIRTGKEMRLSNFLLWQSSYAELLFLDLHWPEFTPKHFYQALLDYQSRARRWGGSYEKT